MYNRPFQITDNRSNNAFSFEKRVNPTLWVPNVVEGGLDDVEIGDQVVFEDFDENGKLKSCIGLRHFVRMEHPTTGKPIVIVDNHNHVFYFWHQALAKGLIEKGGTLVHIDQHKDMRKPDGGPIEDLMEDPMGDSWLKKIFEYSNSVLNVGNYIIPAMEDGLVGKVISITSEADLAQTPRRPNKGSVIVNVDLDFWAPEMDYIDPQLKKLRTKEWMEVADLITIATSPFFIDQPLALKNLQGLLK